MQEALTAGLFEVGLYCVEAQQYVYPTQQCHQLAAPR